MDTLSVNREELLRFMNSGAAEANGHHTALTGLMGEPLAVGLILHYLRGQGKKAAFVSWKVTQGTQRGPWLDAWILADGTLYQTEIKMWAGNAIGGLQLKGDLSPDELSEKAQKQWLTRLWNQEKQAFHSPVVGKVLLPMRPPKGYEHHPVQPLLALWWLVQPSAEAEAWTVLPLPETEAFDKVHIFSLTRYLMSLDTDLVELEMPRLAARLDWLARLFPAKP